MSYFIGVDIGGTNLKAGVVDSAGQIVGEASVPTRAELPQDAVLEDILGAVSQAVKASGVSTKNIRAVGMGSPGMIDYSNGSVIYNNNLGWKDFHISEKMSEALGLPVRLENDADAAALGEVIAGSAKGAKSAMIITLGTGVGAGFVVDGQIYRGSEFGHMVIHAGGRKCNCGRRGCFEAYCSATGLINMTKELIAEHPEGIAASLAAEEGVVSGHTVFLAAEQGDNDAVELIDKYTDYLACGLANLINGLNPEVISIGGGIGKQGERLLAPLRKKIHDEVYEGIRPTMSRIVSCTLGYKAGLIGAAMAVREL